MEHSWLKLTRRDISPVEKWVQDGTVLQMTPLPDGDRTDAMERLRFHLDNPVLTVRGHASSGSDSLYRKLWEELLKGAKA